MRPPHPVRRLPVDNDRNINERVKNILRAEFKNKEGLSAFYGFDYHDHRYQDAGHRSATFPLASDNSSSTIVSWCTETAKHLESSKNQLDYLDKAFRSRAKGDFRLEVPEHEILQSVMHLLRRLPACSSPFNLSLLERFYGTQKSSRSLITQQNAQSYWSEIDVAQYLDTNTIRVAILVVISRFLIERTAFISGRSPLCGHLNRMVAVIDAAYSLMEANREPRLCKSYARLIAFAWTSWQRSSTLALIDELRERLVFAPNPEGPDLKSPRNMGMPSLESLQLPPYICPWAFNMVRSNRCAQGGDFRTIVARLGQYCDEHNHTQPRCIQNTDGRLRQCSGETVEECMRFTGLKVYDQSMHAADCNNIKQCELNRLYWDPVSYRATKGGRAVSIHADVRRGVLKYVTSSDRTLVITHVWSHGQGGRPEPGGSGFNHCLHRRYCRIGLAHGCDSYWIDTTSIPQDYGLRSEAISEINSTFANAKIALVCDKDLMEFDMTRPSIERQEQLLSMVLLCDWNIRAWTFLEAMRGRNNLHLLCKNEVLVSMKSLIYNILDHGSLDLISLFADTHHLIPRRSESSWTLAYFMSDSAGEASHGALWQTVKQGLVKCEEAAHLLSRRHASRPGDEMVIWSLLCGVQAHKTADTFWHEYQIASPHIGGPDRHIKNGYSPLAYSHFVRTGALVSSAPRLQAAGLRWAPATPVPERQLQLNGERKAFHPMDGSKSQEGCVKRGGLKAKWMINSFRVKEAGLDAVQSLSLHKLDPGQVQFYHVRATITSSLLQTYKYGAIVQAAKDGYGDVVPYTVKGSDGATVVVVAGSNNDSLEVWTWLRVVGWPANAILPDGKLREILFD